MSLEGGGGGEVRRDIFTTNFVLFTFTWIKLVNPCLILGNNLAEEFHHLNDTNDGICCGEVLEGQRFLQRGDNKDGISLEQIH